ncbi:hypothetical protein QYF61_021736 [Mycteria americana]|uniref:Uncharacterized protein n=1 Tax=Mycteria americana TaxID=33587 RepID=A0AAN7PL46_MYCAM|nr:hypothetical protein QYF61_021736 [Mycteria americana]
MHLISQQVQDKAVAVLGELNPCLVMVEKAGNHSGTELHRAEVKDGDGNLFLSHHIVMKLKAGAGLKDTVFDKYPIQKAISLGWRLNHFPGQPVPMHDNPFSEVKFPNIQSKPPLAQLEAISSCPIACYLGEETDPHLSTTSFQAKQPQFSQLLLRRLLLQTLHQLCCPALDTLQHLNVSLVVRGPKLNTVFEAGSNLGRVKVTAGINVVCVMGVGKEEMVEGQEMVLPRSRS